MRVYLWNRWKQRRIFRNDNWVIFGLQRKQTSSNSHFYKIAFFGFEIVFYLTKSTNE